jgi:hypothetical protein
MMMAMEFLSCLTRKTAAASFTPYKLGYWLSCCCKWWNSLHKNMHIHIVHVIYREMHHELLKTFVIGIGEGSAFRSLGFKAPVLRLVGRVDRLKFPEGSKSRPFTCA